jgi:hypothetical protein
MFNIQVKDLLHTAMLAAIGAAVSFIVSFGLNTLTSYLKQRWQKRGTP